MKEWRNEGMDESFQIDGDENVIKENPIISNVITLNVWLQTIFANFSFILKIFLDQVLLKALNSYLLYLILFILLAVNNGLHAKKF